MNQQQQKQILALQKKARERRRAHAFVVEGVRLFSEAPRERIRYTVVSQSFLKQPQNRKLLEGIPYETVTDSYFESLSDTKSPQGVLAVLEQYEYRLEDLLPKQGNALLLVLDTIQDPGNLGTMFRTGEGAGISGVIMDKCTVDIYNPKTIRSTMGAIYRVPFVYVDDLHLAINKLKEKDISVYAAHLEDSVDYDEPDYTKGCAFLIGNEGNGLMKETADLADSYIKIPMAGQVESLNAAVAATVLMFEVSRQRRHK